MPDKDPNSQSDFMIEKIKTRPINRRKLIRRTIITAAMAVIFGLIACVTFLVLEPVISNWLYPEEEPQAPYVTFPEDQEEMSPEEMLAENIPTESPIPPELSGEPSLGEEQIQEILEGVDLGVENYAQLYSAMQDFIYKDYLSDDGSEYRAGLIQYMVTVRGVTSNIDWFDNVQESSNQASGLIVADNGVELFILVDYTSLEKAENLVLELHDGFYQIEAELKGVDEDTNLAVIAVEKDRMPVEYMEIGGVMVATLGSSSGNLEGTPVIAMGSPMGVNGSIGYGVITYADTRLTGTDRNYRLLLTNINGSKNAEGALFNLKGQVVGIITANKTGGDMANFINAYGITEIKRIIEKLSNQQEFAYLGITGTDVTLRAHMDLGVPYGAYVTEVEMDSPAMLAGIQVGDVITAIDEMSIQSFSSYCSQLMRMEPEQGVELQVMRQAQDVYREMSFFIELGTR